MSIAFIINPDFRRRSGRTRRGRAPSSRRPSSIAHGDPAEVFVTERAGHARELTKPRPSRAARGWSWPGAATARSTRWRPRWRSATCRSASCLRVRATASRASSASTAVPSARSPGDCRRAAARSTSAKSTTASSSTSRASASTRTSPPQFNERGESPPRVRRYAAITARALLTYVPAALRHHRRRQLSRATCASSSRSRTRRSSATARASRRARARRRPARPGRGGGALANRRRSPAAAPVQRTVERAGLLDPPRSRARRSKATSRCVSRRRRAGAGRHAARVRVHPAALRVAV